MTSKLLAVWDRLTMSMVQLPLGPVTLTLLLATKMALIQFDRAIKRAPVLKLEGNHLPAFLIIKRRRMTLDANKLDTRKNPRALAG
jgi:hypothetical protein